LLGLLDTPNSGEILYRGRDLRALSAEAAARVRNHEFGFVFQAFHLLNEFTALENVLMPARIGAGTVKWLAGAKNYENEARDFDGTRGPWPAPAPHADAAFRRRTPARGACAAP